MAINDLLALPAKERARIALALLDSLAPQGGELTEQQEDALIHERDTGEFISEAEFFAPFDKAG